MTKPKNLVLLVLVLVLAWWAWGMLFPNPEKIIRKQMTKLAEAGSFKGGGGNISGILSVDKLGGFFATQIELALNLRGVDVRDTRTRQELKEMVMGMRGSLNSVHIEFLDMRVEMMPGKESATVNLTLNATVNGEKNYVVEEFKFNLKKIDGDWLITRVQNVPTLR